MLVMARDVFHNAVRRALETDGWTITHDPLVVPFGDHNLFVDLGAERMLAAEKADRKIAVEIKSFLSRSPVEDLERALGNMCSITRSCAATSRRGRFFSPCPTAPSKGS